MFSVKNSTCKTEEVKKMIKNMSYATMFENTAV
jgi:hypothetical protein